MRDVVFRFIDAADDADALAVDAGCAAGTAAAAGVSADRRGRADVAARAVAMIEVRGLAKRSLRRRRPAARRRGRLAQRSVDAARREAPRACTPSATSASSRRTASITGLLGPNGAGKTTTLRMLAALITPDAGNDARRRHRRRRAAARGAGAHGRAVGRARPLPAPDRAREHRLLRRPAGHGARRRRCARPGPGAHVRDDARCSTAAPPASARASA